MAVWRYKILAPISHDGTLHRMTLCRDHCVLVLYCYVAKCRPDGEITLYCYICTASVILWYLLVHLMASGGHPKR